MWSSISRAEEDDALVEQARVDVEAALAARRLLDDDRDKALISGSMGCYSLVVSWVGGLTAPHRCADRAIGSERASLCYLSDRHEARFYLRAYWDASPK